MPSKSNFMSKSCSDYPIFYKTPKFYFQIYQIRVMRNAMHWKVFDFNWYNDFCYTRYTVYYTQKFESRRWMPDPDTGNPFKMSLEDSTTDHGWRIYFPPPPPPLLLEISSFGLIGLKRELFLKTEMKINFGILQWPRYSSKI